MKSKSGKTREKAVSSSNPKDKITIPKHLEIRGVPGAGKTKALVELCKRFKAQGAHTKEIRVLSFAKATVNPLQQRLKQEGLGDIEVTTVHKFALKLVRSNDQSSGSERQTVLAPSETVKTLSKALNKVLSKASPIKKESLVNWLKQENLSPKALFQMLSIQSASGQKLKDQIAEDGRDWSSADLMFVKAISGEYSRLKRRHSKADFGDLIVKACKVLETDSSAVQQYRYLLVDEYQDCGASQGRLIAAAGRYIPTVVVVGDPNQALYGFGGSRYTPLRGLLDEVVEWEMNKSHRMTRPIAALAQSVLTQKCPVIETDKEGACPVFVTHANQHQQAVQIALEIRELIDKGVKPSQIAVLGRTRESCSYVEKELQACGVHVRSAGTEQSHRHVRRVAWLAFKAGAVERRTQLKASDLEKKMFTLEATTKQFETAAADLQKVNAATFEGRFLQCRNLYLTLIGGPRNNVAVRNLINRWAPLCRTFDSPIALRDETTRVEACTPVTSSTIHAAKGMEWDYVFLVGVTDGVMPIHYAKSESQFAEEHRLLYVGITRAAVQLHLYHAPASNARARKKFTHPSPFITNALTAGVLVPRQGGKPKPAVLGQGELV